MDNFNSHSATPDNFVSSFSESMIKKISTFATSTHSLLWALNHKLNHSTTLEEEKIRINKYINDIFTRSEKILKKDPENIMIMTPLTFEKTDLEYFVSILNLYITDEWAKVNLEDDIEVECTQDWLFYYTALQRYYQQLINS
jgi:hypothetical protein